MNEIAAYILGKAVDKAPSWILSKFVSITKLASEIKIKPRDNKHVHIDLQSQPPRIELYFEITNLSHFNIILDRLLIEVWLSQPLFEGALLKRRIIGPRRIEPDVHFRHYLTESQAKIAHDFQAKNDPTVTPTIHLVGYFVTKIGIAQVEQRIPKF